VRKFELEEDDWKIVGSLVSVLKVCGITTRTITCSLLAQQFEQATVYFSQDTASAVVVIPAMDRLTSGLDPQTKEKYPAVIVAALKLARKKLDQYYSLTDSSVVYRIAMVLHPRMKLEYFKQADWEADWIEQAESLVCDEYVSSYQAKLGSMPAAPAVTSEYSNNFTDFSNLSVTTVPHSNELDDYLRLTIENVKDPLLWWHNNRFVYPTLHRMALNYLSAPATSTAVE
jgi:hypothetical protein